MAEPIDRSEQIESCLDFLQKEVNNIEDTKLRELCQEVLNDVGFTSCPGSQKKHHAYPGGLVVHTSEVLEIALNICESNCLSVDKDALVTGIVFHDLGKVFEYTVDDNGVIAYTTHKEMIMHLPRSFAEFIKLSDELSAPTQEKIGHIILAHHGRKEWGSPVEPAIIEAHIIHYADMLSYMYSKDLYIRD